MSSYTPSAGEPPAGPPAGEPPAEGQIVGPPVVYVPVRLDAQGAVEEIVMLRMGDGQVALLAYSALDRFIDCCGEQQPWMLFETAKLVDLHQTKPFDTKLLDVELPAEVRAMLQSGAP